MSRFFMFFLMELGWKALIAFMIYFWSTPFGGQSVIMVTILVSGIVQVTYLLSDKPNEEIKKGVAPKKEPPKKEVKQ